MLSAIQLGPRVRVARAQLPRARDDGNAPPPPLPLTPLARHHSLAPPTKAPPAAPEEVFGLCLGDQAGGGWRLQVLDEERLRREWDQREEQRAAEKRARAARILQVRAPPPPPRPPARGGAPPSGCSRVSQPAGRARLRSRASSRRRPRCWRAMHAPCVRPSPIPHPPGLASRHRCSTASPACRACGAETWSRRRPRRRRTSATPWLPAPPAVRWRRARSSSRPRLASSRRRRPRRRRRLLRRRRPPCRLWRLSLGWRTSTRRSVWLRRRCGLPRGGTPSGCGLPPCAHTPCAACSACAAAIQRCRSSTKLRVAHPASRPPPPRHHPRTQAQPHVTSSPNRRRVASVRVKAPGGPAVVAAAARSHHEGGFARAASAAALRAIAAAVAPGLGPACIPGYISEAVTLPAHAPQVGRGLRDVGGPDVCAPQVGRTGAKRAAERAAWATHRPRLGCRAPASEKLLNALRCCPHACRRAA